MGTCRVESGCAFRSARKGSFPGPAVRFPRAENVCGKTRTVSKGPREDRKGDRTLSDADPLLPEFPSFLIRRVQVPVHVDTRLNSLIRKRTSRTLRKEACSYPEYVLFYHEFPIKKEPCAKFIPDQESRSASGYEPVRPNLTVRFSQTFFLPL